MKLNLLFKEKYSKIVLSLIIYLLLLPLLNVPGTVLCIGNDGHVALEKASSGSKCGFILNDPQSNNPGDSEFNEESNIADAGHCGDCKDIAISKSEKDQHLVPVYDLRAEKDFYKLPIIITAGYESADKNNDLSFTTAVIKPSTPITQSTVIRC